MVALLQPQVCSLGILLSSQLEGVILGAPDRLFSSSVLLFVIAYILFQR